MTPDNVTDWPALRDQAMALLRPAAGTAGSTAAPDTVAGREP